MYTKRYTDFEYFRSNIKSYFLISGTTELETCVGPFELAWQSEDSFMNIYEYWISCMTV